MSLRRNQREEVYRQAKHVEILPKIFSHVSEWNMIKYDMRQEKNLSPELAAYHEWANTVMPQRLARAIFPHIPDSCVVSTQWFPASFLQGIYRFEDERMLQLIEARLASGRYSPQQPLRIIFVADGETLQGTAHEWGGPVLARYLACAHPQRGSLEILSSTWSHTNNVKCILLIEVDGEKRFWGPFPSRKQYALEICESKVKLFQEYPWHETYWSGVPGFIFNWYAGKPVHAWFSHGLHAAVEQECFGLQVRNDVNVTQAQVWQQKYDLLFMRSGTPELCFEQFDICSRFVPDVLKQGGEYLLHFYDKMHGDISLCETSGGINFRDFCASIER